MFGKITIVVALLAFLCAGGGIALAHWELVKPTVGMGIFVLGGLLGFLASLLAVAAIFVSQSYGAAMVGVLGALPFITLLAGAITAFQVPRINDISSDLQNPPAFAHAGTLPENAGRDMAYRNPWEEENGEAAYRKAYGGVQPLVLKADPALAYTRAHEIARSQKDWTITHEDEAARTFEGVATTKTFRWKDDFIVRVTPGADGGSIVDMRSKSRDGKSDLGANAKRILQFFDALKKME